MASLSWVRGRPVAQEYKHGVACRILHVADGKAGDDSEAMSDPVDVLGGDFLRALRADDGKKLKQTDLESLLDALEGGEEPAEDLLLSGAYEAAAAAYKSEDATSVTLPSGAYFTPIPNFAAERCVLYAGGMSGSGKTWVIARWLDAWRAMEPKKEIHWFSRVVGDPAVAHIGDMKVHQIDEKMLDPAGFPAIPDGSVVCYDDIDTLQPPALAKAVQAHRDGLLETGRHSRISVACTAHALNNYNRTRLMLLESTEVVFFNGSSSFHITYLLKHYAGLSPAAVRKVLALGSRWCMWLKGHPPILLHEQGCTLLSALETGGK